MRTIAIVGFAGSSRELVNKEPQTTEVWGLNNAYAQGFMKVPASRWFDIHGYEGREEFRVKHWSQMVELGIPIYALHPPIPVPDNVHWLDFRQICEDLDQLPDWFDEPPPYDSVGVEPYFTNTVVYMLAQAIWELVQENEPGEIKLFGIDMATGTEFEKQRFCCEYWIGFARGKGIKVTIPDVAPLCKGLLYGIDKDDGFARRAMIDMTSDLRKQQTGDTAQYHKIKGGIEQVQGIVRAIQDYQQDHDGEITVEAIHEILNGIYGALLQAEKEAAYQYHAVDGALQALRNLMTQINLPSMPHSEIAETILPEIAPPDYLTQPAVNGHQQEEVLTNA